MRKRTQPNDVAKKGLAIGLSALLGLGGVGAATYGIVKSLKDDMGSEIEYNVDDLLTEDFDINNESEVQKRAKAIYDISEKNVSVEDIVDLIYYVNGKYEKVSFKENATDVDKYKRVSELNQALVTILSDNKRDDIMALEESLNGKEKGYSKEEMSEVSMLVEDDKEIFGYMFLPKTNEVKQNALKFYDCVYNQLDDIKNGNVTDYDANSQAFYELFVQLSNSDIDDYHKLLAMVDFRSKLNLFTLTDEQVEKIDADFISLSNKVGIAFINVHGVNEDEVVKDAIANGTGNEITPDGNKYNKEDAKDAEKYAGNDSVDKVLVDNGGANIGTQTEVVGGGDIIGTEIHTEINTEVETIITEYIDGGDVIETIVETSIVQIDGEEEETIIVEEGGFVVDEGDVVVEEGGVVIEEPHGEVYSDEDADKVYSDANVGSTQYTLR